MTIITPIRRSLGTMIVYGYPKAPLAGELQIARRIGAGVLEILPDWRTYPDPRELHERTGAAGLGIHSVHGCWGGQTIRARQVDLGALDPSIRSESLDDIRRCVDWTQAAGGSFLVVHPGGLSDPVDFAARRAALLDSLRTLAPHAQALSVVVCVENMPPGVHPGTNMADLADLVAEVNNPWIDLALDTGHAAISEGVADYGRRDLAATTDAAGRYLATTHVHDNNGRQDVHWPPGLGVVDWDGWVEALDAINYRGPIMLECIRHLRQSPASIDESFLARLEKMTGLERS